MKKLPHQSGAVCASEFATTSMQTFCLSSLLTFFHRRYGKYKVDRFYGFADRLVLPSEHQPAAALRRFL
jgi:hypothetical protein